MRRSSPSSPLESLIAETREENIQRARAAGAEAPRPARRLASGPEPDLRLETRAVSRPTDASGRARSRLLPVSFALHAGVLSAALTLPLLIVEELPAPAAKVTAFFVEPLSAPPPPPPPPPPAPAQTAASRSAPRPVEPAARTFTAPIETPTEIKPEEGVDLGVPGGVPGGVEGGVPGGVVGGVIGGLPEAPPPPKPIRVGGAIKEPKRLKYVEPTYPPMARRANVEGLVILECTITPAGRVVDCRVLRGVPMLDEAAVEAVSQWVYAPTLLDGVPVPVVMTFTVNFGLKRGAAGGP